MLLWGRETSSAAEAWGEKRQGRERGNRNEERSARLGKGRSKGRGERHAAVGQREMLMWGRETRKQG